MDNGEKILLGLIRPDLVKKDEKVRKLVEFTRKFVEFMATEENETYPAHDDQFDRLCEIEEPMGCLICEGRAILKEFEEEE